GGCGAGASCAVVDLAVGGGVDIQAALADRPAGGMESNYIITAAVAVVYRVAGIDRQGSGAGIAAVVAFAYACDRVAGLHAAGAGWAVLGQVSALQPAVPIAAAAS